MTKKTIRLALLLAASAVGCSGEDAAAPDVIDRQVFIDTYVDLRVTALSEEDGVIDDAERAEVLARHGVRESDLLEFARLRGDDAEFMREVWNQIEARLDTARIRPDSASG